MIFQTDRSSRSLAYWCQKIGSLKEGQCLDVDIRELRDISSFEHNDATFTPADRILGNIMGSDYTHSYKLHPYKPVVTFIRHKDTGELRHKDPDHEFRLRRLNNGR